EKQVEMKIDQVIEDWIEYHEKSGVDVGQKFSTNDQDLVGQTLKVWARIKGTDLESDTVQFKVMKPVAEDEFEEIVFPVVFHIMQTKDDLAIKGGELEAHKIHEAIERLNNVFSGVSSKHPNRVNTKIRFEAALYDPQGNLLEEPGINRLAPMHNSIGYGQDKYEWFIRDKFDKAKNNTNLSEEEKAEFYFPQSGTNNLFWSPDKYLQFWLISDVNRSDLFEGQVSAECFPTSKYKESEEFTEDGPAVPQGLNFPYNEDNMIPYTWHTGIKLCLQNFNNSYESLTYDSGKNDWVYYVGLYFGLKPAFGGGWSSANDDFCDDTFNTGVSGYQQWGWVPGRPPAKYDDNKSGPFMYGLVNGQAHEFVAEHIMSAPHAIHRCITKNQAERIHWIIKNCPQRQAWNNEFALTGVDKIRVERN
ncbi:MAG: hypothetical protein MI866_23070, partial [Bacteroidales bacterium]|nr:hypothetical protein [Bacteroidales bacterium]